MVLYCRLIRLTYPTLWVVTKSLCHRSSLSNLILCYRPLRIKNWIRWRIHLILSRTTQYTLHFYQSYRRNSRQTISNFNFIKFNFRVPARLNFFVEANSWSVSLFWITEGSLSGNVGYWYCFGWRHLIFQIIYIIPIVCLYVNLGFQGVLQRMINWCVFDHFDFKNVGFLVATRFLTELIPAIFAMGSVFGDSRRGSGDLKDLFLHISFWNLNTRNFDICKMWTVRVTFSQILVRRSNTLLRVQFATLWAESSSSLWSYD